MVCEKKGHNMGKGISRPWYRGSALLAQPKWEEYTGTTALTLTMRYHPLGAGFLTINTSFRRPSASLITTVVCLQVGLSLVGEFLETSLTGAVAS